jgi:DNA polymerase III subunit epsilon
MRPLVFVDCETTGLDPDRHELIEVAAIRVDPRTLKIETELALKVHLERIEDADPDALRINGYTEEAWSDAVSLAEAMQQLAPVLDGCMLAGHNVAFDRSFLDAAWKHVGHRPNGLDHHLLDTATLAWPLLSAGSLDSVSLTPVCKRLGIERGEEHWALDDARASLEVAKRLLPVMEDHAQLSAFAGDERAIFRTLLRRIDAGRSEYGPWKADDGRQYLREALAEVLDALHYCAAELVRLDRKRTVPGFRTRRVYVCHPYRNAPKENVERVTAICKALSASGHLPVAPQLYLPQFMDEATDRERALAMCLELLDASDEVRVYGQSITAGMRLEIERAEARGLPVRFVDAETV